MVFSKLGRCLAVIFYLCAAANPRAYSAPAQSSSIVTRQEMDEAKSKLHDQGVKLDLLAQRVADAIDIKGSIYQNGLNQINTLLSIVLSIFTVLTFISGFLGVSTYAKIRNARISAEKATEAMKAQIQTIEELDRKLSELDDKYRILISEKVEQIVAIFARYSADAFGVPLGENMIESAEFLYKNKENLNPREKYIIAASKYNSGDYNLATDLLKELLADDPINPRYLNAYGQVVLKKGSPQEAIGIFQAASKASPSLWQAKFYEAVCLKELDRPSEAFSLIQDGDIVRSSSGDPIVLLNLGAIMVDLNYPTEALEQLKMAEQAYNEKKQSIPADLFLDRACAYSQLKNKQAASENLVAAIKMDATMRSDAIGDAQIRSLFTEDELRNLNT